MRLGTQHSSPKWHPDKIIAWIADSNHTTGKVSLLANTDLEVRNSFDRSAGHPATVSLIPPKILKPPRRQRRIAGRVLDIAVPEVGLQRSRIDPVIGELEAAGMPQHVGMRLDPELSDDGCSFDHAIKPRRHQRCPALRYKDKRRRRAVALVTAELTPGRSGDG